jgi:two-component system, cell cycle sensor histidine kinase and response regulator CckA
VGIVASLPAIVWEADGTDYRITFVSGRARDLLGHSPDDWVNIPDFWENHLHPEDRDRAIAQVEAALRDRSIGDVQYRFRHDDGSHRWFRDTFSVLEEDDGSLRLTGLMLDITEEHAAREAQERAEAERDRLIEAVEQSAESISIADEHDRLVYVNAGFERNTGYTRDEVLGSPPAFLPARIPGQPSFDAIAASITEDGIWSGEIVNARKDGSTYREAITISAIRDATGRVVGRVAAGRDITREREVEAQLAQAARMEAIGQLAGGVAHDFNNLLTAILGYGSLLGETIAPGTAQAADLAEIVAAARRAQSLTSQLLAFGRRALLQPRNVPPADLVLGLAPMLERLIGEDVALKVTVLTERHVLIDPGQLEQAVVNLVVNARDAMPSGGVITLAVRLGRPGDFSTLDAGDAIGAGDQDWVVVEVADSGVGMTEEVRARAFEPFFTTKPVGRGTGLGLAMVEGFIRQSGGTVAIDTAPGDGTRIALILPAVDGGPASRAPDAPAAAAPVDRLTALVVEDEAALRRLAARTLRGAGHTVLEAGSGEAALALADSHIGPIDVLFTDVVMPGISGPMLAAQLTQRYPGIRVVLTSGYTESEVARRGLAVTPSGFLHKPYAPAELLAALSGRS